MVARWATARPSQSPSLEGELWNRRASALPRTCGRSGPGRPGETIDVAGFGVVRWAIGFTTGSGRGVGGFPGEPAANLRPEAFAGLRRSDRDRHFCQYRPRLCRGCNGNPGSMTGWKVT
jgi:hypothetical protein